MTTLHAGEDVRKDGFYTAYRSINSCYNHLAHNMSFSTKIENVCTLWPRNSLLEIHAHMHQEKYPRMYIIALFIILTNSEQPKRPSTIGEISKLCVTAVDYYAAQWISAIKTTWIFKLFDKKCIWHDPIYRKLIRCSEIQGKGNAIMEKMKLQTQNAGS